jgi:hypothetical protein
MQKSRDCQIQQLKGALQNPGRLAAALTIAAKVE